MATIQVIIPAYNAAAFIGAAIESVLSQSLGGIALTVLDNASTDDTAEMVRSFGTHRVEYLRNERNIGGIPNHNRALEIARSDYLKLLSADDVLLPTVIEKQARALDRHPAVGIATCNYAETDADLRLVKEIRFLPGYSSGAAAIRACATGVSNLVGAPSNTLIRRSAVRGARFDPRLKWMGDLDFACQMLKGCDLFNIDEVGFCYRRHDANDSLIGCTAGVRLRDDLAFMRRYGGGGPALARIAYRLVRSGTLAASKLWRVWRERSWRDNLGLPASCHAPDDDSGAVVDWRIEILPFQWRIALSWISGYFIFQLFNPFLFAYQGAVEAGRVGLALAACTAILGLGMSWINATTPAMAALVARGERAALNRRFASVLGRSMAFTALASVALVAGVELMRAHGLAMASRIADWPVLALLGAAALANNLIGGLAIYMRCHKEEPMLANSLTTGALVLAAVAIGSRHGVLLPIALYFLVTVAVTLPWCVAVFLRRYWRRPEGVPLATVRIS